MGLGSRTPRPTDDDTPGFPVINRAVTVHVDAGGDDGYVAIVLRRIGGEVSVTNDDVIADTAKQLGLSWKLEPAQPAIGVCRVEQVDGIIEVEYDGPAEVLQQPLDEGGPCYCRGPVDQDGIIPSNRESFSQAAGQRQQGHYRFFNVVARFVQKSHQVPIDGG